MTKEEIKKNLEEIGTARYAIIPNKINYDKLIRQMRSLIRMAKEVIEESEKPSPNNILISDIAVGEMSELFDEISSNVRGNGLTIS